MAQKDLRCAHGTDSAPVFDHRMADICDPIWVLWRMDCAAFRAALAVCAGLGGDDRSAIFAAT